jgi:hypothetical protein
MKTWSIILTATLLVAIALAAGLLFADRHATVASLRDSEVGDVRVLGESEDRFEEWSFRLSWRKGNGPWMEYLLDRQVALWSNVELIRLTNAVAVKRHGEIVGTLNTVDGSFSNQLRARLESRPQVIVTSENPFDRASRIYPENPSWKSVWPTVALQSK